MVCSLQSQSRSTLQPSKSPGVMKDSATASPTFLDFNLLLEPLLVAPTITLRVQVRRGTPPSTCSPDSHVRPAFRLAKAALIQQAANLLLDEGSSQLAASFCFFCSRNVDYTSAQQSSTPAQQQHSPTSEQMLHVTRRNRTLPVAQICILLLDTAESSHLLNREEQGKLYPQGKK